jgi:hypothetical protein
MSSGSPILGRNQPCSSHFCKLICGSDNENLWRFENLIQEMILIFFPLDEFLFRENMGVDLPADFLGDIHQQTRQFSQSDITDNHEIEIASGLFLLSGERPEYEGDPDVCFVAKGIYNDIRKPAWLEDEGADFGINPSLTRATALL